MTTDRHTPSSPSISAAKRGLGTALALTLMLAGCASNQGDWSSSGGSSRGGGASSTGASQGGPAMPSARGDARPGADGKTQGGNGPLATERRYLADWFAGTPVVIELERDGSLLVDVPLQFAFDPGQSRIKPPLAKVLDRVATSLRRVVTAKVNVNAPADAGRADAALADQRARAVRDAIVARGVNALRMGNLTTATTPGVQIRLVMPAP